MLLQLKYKTKEEIPQQYAELYTEVNGEWVFTGIAGIKTQTDIDRLTTALAKERDDHKATKALLHTWDGLTREDVDKKLSRLEELEVMVQGSVPKADLDKRLDELTEARVKARLMPVEREKTALGEKLKAAEAELGQLKAEKVRRTIRDKVREAAVAAKVLPEAEPDALLLAETVFELTEDGQVLTKENGHGVTPRLAPEFFFQELQEKRPHWWPKSTGGGSHGGGKAGGGMPNPWAADSWNLTEQGKYIREHGEAKAQQMAQLAGTTVGGPKPQPKK